MCARRPGYYCPTPAAELPCPPGEWCTQAAVAPTTCEYPVLMARRPELTVPDEPLTIVQRVYAKGEPLGGNICPPVRALNRALETLKTLHPQRHPCGWCVHWERQLKFEPACLPGSLSREHDTCEGEDFHQLYAKGEPLGGNICPPVRALNRALEPFSP